MEDVWVRPPGGPLVGRAVPGEPGDGNSEKFRAKFAKDAKEKGKTKIFPQRRGDAEREIGMGEEEEGGLGGVWQGP